MRAVPARPAAGRRPRAPSIAAALNPANWVRRRFRAWLRSRLPARDSMLLTQRNIYILPTPAGFMFGITLLVLLIASVNYQLNLGYVLTFLLAGSGIVSMHLTHGTHPGRSGHGSGTASIIARTCSVRPRPAPATGTSRCAIVCGSTSWMSSGAT